QTRNKYHDKKLLPELKGYKRLERHEAKVSRAVLRRGGESNLSFLFGRVNVSLCPLCALWFLRGRRFNKFHNLEMSSLYIISNVCAF
ncbi:MAG: hypothetical protein K8F55_07195, partial [Candidatus Methanoperedens nitroreducens]|nr:hypothetical protein [Candidatus Methanoperedens nitroreducens]